MLDHVEGPILSDSHYVFSTLARRVFSLNLAFSGRFVRLANFGFETLARVNKLSGNIFFSALVPAGSTLHFLSQRDSKVPKIGFSRSAKS